MSDDEVQFESADAGASKTVPQQGGFVMIKDRPCKVVEMSTSKVVPMLQFTECQTGKHGHAKVHLIAIDIFTGRKLEELCPSTHNMNVPIVKRVDMQLIDISDDGFLSLMTENGETRDDLKVPEGEVGEEIVARHAAEEQLLITILSACDEECAIAVKGLPK